MRNYATGLREWILQLGYAIGLRDWTMKLDWTTGLGRDWSTESDRDRPMMHITRRHDVRA